MSYQQYNLQSESQTWLNVYYIREGDMDRLLDNGEELWPCQYSIFNQLLFYLLAKYKPDRINEWYGFRTE